MAGLGQKQNQGSRVSGVPQKFWHKRFFKRSEISAALAENSEAPRCRSHKAPDIGVECGDRISEK